MNDSTWPAAAIAAARAELGRSVPALAVLLGYSSRARLYEVEAGRKRPHESVTRLLQAFLDGYRCPDWAEPDPAQPTLSPAEIRAARDELGLSVPELAAALGYSSPARLYDLERGTKAPSASIVRLLRAYRAGYRPADWPGRKIKGAGETEGPKPARASEAARAPFARTPRADLVVAAAV